MDFQDDEKLAEAPLSIKVVLTAILWVARPTMAVNRWRWRRSGRLVTKPATRAGRDSMHRPYDVGDLVEVDTLTNWSEVR